MKKTADLGPEPTPPPAPPLPPTRASLLAALQSAGGPVGMAALADRTGLHVNTLREHLDALVAARLVRRERAAPTGRGRPAWLYAATRTREASPYAALAATLAVALAETSASPSEDAARAGTGWGRDLAREREPHGEPEEAVRELLDDLGFAPERSAPNVLRLTRCPLLDAARAHPDVVCAVHLGIVRGALAELGASAEGVRLLPFVEPGACRLELA